MKRRSLTVLLCLLAIISLASVGFASWVISVADTEEATGSIQVEEVLDERLEIIELTFSVEDSEIPAYVHGVSEAEDIPSFKFGLPKTEAEGIKKVWLNNNKLGQEVLKIHVSFKVAKKTDTQKTPITDLTEKEISVAFEVISGNLSVDGKVYATIANAAPKVTFSSDDNTYNFDIELNWGSYFNEQNPFNYYNLKDPDGYVNGNNGATWADEAFERLGALNEALKDAQYKVTIKVEPKSATSN